MKNAKWIVLTLIGMSIGWSTFGQMQEDESWREYVPTIKKYIYKDYQGMFREAGGSFKYPFMTPGSEQYADWLWDWDSWLSNVALRQILLEKNNAKEMAKAVPYEQGSILNFLSYGSMDGWIPISVMRDETLEEIKPKDIYAENMHKPCLAQHAAFLTQLSDGDAEWLRDKFFFLQAFVNNYINHHRHRATGLYFWQNDSRIGVDNDPGTYYRPDRSSGSIYLNTMMYKELQAMVYLSNQLGLTEVSAEYAEFAEELKVNIHEHCWDPRDGFFYNVDLNLLPLREEKAWIDHHHSGAPRTWDCLIQRIGVWTGFMPMWAGLATPEQAERIVAEHYADTTTFNAPYGIRTLSRMEKMYTIRGSGNPSSWLGPIWGISNYMVFRGLVNYGYEAEARELAIKTVKLFGRDFERFGALHEYYQPENGEPVLNRGFQNWNFLVLNMIAWLDGEPVIAEF